MAQDDIPPLDEYDLDDDSSEEYDIDEDGEDLVVPTPLASYDVPDEKPEEHDLSFDEERIPEYSPLDRYRDNLSDDKERNKIGGRHRRCAPGSSRWCSRSLLWACGGSRFPDSAPRSGFPWRRPRRRRA
jgi:hypothetical protein